MKEPTLLDVFAAFITHAVIVTGVNHVKAADVYDTAELLLSESEKRHGHRPE